MGIVISHEIRIPSLNKQDSMECQQGFEKNMVVSKNGGFPQQSWVFLLKMIIFWGGDWGGKPTILGNPHILTWRSAWLSSYAVGSGSLRSCVKPPL